MRRIEFSSDELREIERDRYGHADPAVRRRMETLWLKANGEKHRRIVELAGVSRPTVQQLLDTFIAGRLAAVRTYHWKAPVSAPTPHRNLLAKESVVLTQPESDRAALEVHEKSRVKFAAPAMLRRLSAGDRQVPRRTEHHASLEDRQLDDPQFSDVWKCINARKVSYSYAPCCGIRVVAFGSDPGV